MKLRIAGYLTDSVTNTGLFGLKVEVWSVHDQLVKTLSTGALGEFLIELDEFHLQLFFGNSEPEFYFKVLDDNYLLENTKGSLHWTMQRGSPLIFLEVEIEPSIENSHLYRLTTDCSMPINSEPNQQSEILEIAPVGSRCSVLATDQDWMFIESSEGKQGWVSKKKLRRIAQAETEFKQRSRASLLNVNALAEIEEALTLLENSGDEQVVDYREAVKQMLRRAELANHLAYDAAGFLNNDPNSERRFVSLIDFLLNRQSSSTKMPYSTKIWRTEPFPRSPVDPTLPDPSGPTPPEFPPEHRHPCLIDPRSFARINAGIARLASTRERNHPVADLQTEAALSEALQDVMQPVIQLEAIHDAAKVVTQGEEASLKRFRAVLDWVMHDSEAATNLASQTRARDIDVPSEQNPIPWPGDSGIGADWIIDICRPERGEGSANAVRCLCGERYKVTDIVTLDRVLPSEEPYHREGCPGEWIEIQGEGFGDSRTWGIGDMKSEVIFSSDGREGVSPTDEDYRSWENNRVQVRVPAILCSHLS